MLLWISIWISLDFYGYPWISMDIHSLTCYGSSIQGSVSGNSKRGANYGGYFVMLGEELFDLFTVRVSDISSAYRHDWTLASSGLLHQCLFKFCV